MHELGEKLNVSSQASLQTIETSVCRKLAAGCFLSDAVLERLIGNAKEAARGWP